MPSSLPVLWITTITVANSVEKQTSYPVSAVLALEDDRLASLISWFSGSTSDNDHLLNINLKVHLDSESPNTIILKALTEDDRRSVFSNYFSTLHLLPRKLYDARMQVIKARIQIH